MRRKDKTDGEMLGKELSFWEKINKEMPKRGSWAFSFRVWTLAMGCDAWN